MKNDIETMIIDKLLFDINHGIYKNNSKLPSENELADSFKVPRIMVRKAYEKLEEMGYINSIQGKGRYLKERHKQIELMLSGDESFSKKMINKGYDFSSINIFCEKIVYDEKIYNELGVGKDDDVYRIGRLRIIDKRPSAIHISYVAKSIFKDISEIGKSIVSIFQYYKDKGYEQFDSEKSILSISFPTLEERELLECSSLIPLLIVETNCIDKISNKVLEYTKIIYRSDCFKYVVS
jgi:GntR family transcriptional regulator